MDYRDINKKIDDIVRVANREERRMLINLKKAFSCYNNKMYYECYYDKRLCLSNYNKFVEDVSDLHKENFYFLFIRIPGINTNCHLDNSKREAEELFINKLKEEAPLYSLARNNIYVVAEYLVLICGKAEVNEIYQRIKKIKKSNKNFGKYQMTYVKYEKQSSKVAKNINSCIKRANEIFKNNKELNI